MSITVTALVRPSFCQRLLLLGFGLGALAAGALLAAGAEGRADVTFHFALPGAAASVAGGLWCLALFGVGLKKNSNLARLDIFGVGQARLAVYQVKAEVNTQIKAQKNGSPCGWEMAGAEVELLAGSTLWPGLLMLRWRDRAGRVSALQVWPDSVVAGQFRPLVVACRAMPVRTRGAQKNRGND